MILSIKDSLQQQIHFNGDVFGNKCCRCNEGLLYFLVYSLQADIIRNQLNKLCIFGLFRNRFHRNLFAWQVCFSLEMPYV